MHVHEQWLAWSAWWWPSVATHLWQSTLAMAVAGAAVFVSRRDTARVRYVIWLIALLKFALPSVLIGWLAFKAGMQLSIAPAPSASAPPPVLSIGQVAMPLLRLSDPLSGLGRSPASPSEVYGVLTILWVVGALVLLGNWLRRRVLLSREVRLNGTPATLGALQALARATSRLGIRREVRIVLTTRTLDVGVAGIRKPVLVFPAGISEHLTEEELEAVMLHELAHVSRYDNAISTLQMFLFSALWFYPPLWFLDRRLLREREEACDEAVIRAGARAEAYLAAIVKLLGICAGWSVAGASRATGANLGRRMKLIMTRDPNRTMPWSHRSAIVLALLTLVVLVLLSSAANDSRASAPAVRAFASDLVTRGTPEDESIPGQARRAQLAVYAPQLYADKLELRIALIDLPGASETGSNWQCEYQLYFVSEAEHQRMIERKTSQKPAGATVEFNVDPADYNEKILLAEGQVRGSTVATIRDRTYIAGGIDFRDKVPDAQRTKFAQLLTVYRATIFDAKLGRTLTRSGVWLAPPFIAKDEQDSTVGPRSTLFCNFFVAKEGDVFGSQWPRAADDTGWTPPAGTFRRRRETR